MSGNTMLGRPGDRANAPRSQYLGQGGSKVIEKVPHHTKPYANSPAQQEVALRGARHLVRVTAARRNPVGSLWMSDAEIGNVNPTLDWRQALIEGNSAADAPHGYSAFRGS